MNPIYMLLAIPLFFLCIGIEYLVGRIQGKQYYRFNDFITNLNIGVGNQVFGLFLKFMLLGVYIWVFDHYSFFQQAQTWWSFILCLVVYDFLFYWAHRWGHEINYFWGAHIVHHQSEDFNLGVALRQSWFHNLIAFFIFMPMPFLGFDPVIFIIASATSTFYQFWIHTEAIDRLPRWFEFIMNTPAHHRVHHAVNPKYLDKNYAGVFIIWDRMFGTFKEEEERPTYGITTGFPSWNPTWANLHYYVELFRLGRKMRRWKDRWKLIWAAPGWRPDEMGGPVKAQEPGDRKSRKFNARAGKLQHAYIAFQFVLIVLGTMAYIYFFDALHIGYKLLFAGLIILSTMICGAIFERKQWVRFAEYLRLGMVLVSLNILYYFRYFDWFMVMLVASSIMFLVLVTWFTLARKQLQIKAKPSG